MILKSRVGAAFSALLLGCFGQWSAEAASYHVSIGGSDTNFGTADFPWRTIQKAADVMVAGDEVTVHAGSYDERVLSKRGGTTETNRITFKADGVATMRGFSINHPYLTVNGFDISGHSAASRFTAFIEVQANGDYAQVLNNRVRDGITISRTDMVFASNAPSPNTISSATGGFLAAGLRAGMTIRVERLSESVALANSGRTLLVDAVTDNLIQLSTNTSPFNQTISSEGPTSAYLSGSPNYGLVLRDGANYAIVRSNQFSNLSHDVASVGGDNNRYEYNLFEQGNGFNVIVYSGRDNVFRRNWIRASPIMAYVVSPDAAENSPQATTQRLVFEENFIENFDGPLGVHHLQVLGENSGLLFLRNVFVNAGPFAPGIPNTMFLNNTFVSVSTSDFGSSAPELHAILFQTSPGRFSSEGAVVKNNIFVACGDLTKNVNLRGWYDLGGVTTYKADFNFVAGDAPGYVAKTGFNEGRPQLNGGDPGFVNLADPLGPDGKPFTADDGLRLREDSKLLGAGEQGSDLGAYAMPLITAARQPNGKIRIAWSSVGDGYTLQTASTVTGNWQNVVSPRTIENGFSYINVVSTNDAALFRLSR